jgi:hypothetical protein
MVEISSWLMSILLKITKMVKITPTVEMEGVVSTVSLEGEGNDVLLDESLMVENSLNLELE